MLGEKTEEYECFWERWRTFEACGQRIQSYHFHQLTYHACRWTVEREQRNQLFEDWTSRELLRCTELFHISSDWGARENVVTLDISPSLTCVMSDWANVREASSPNNVLLLSLRIPHALSRRLLHECWSRLPPAVCFTWEKDNFWKYADVTPLKFSGVWKQFV